MNRRRQLLATTLGKALILHILHLWLSIVLTPISILSEGGGEGGRGEIFQQIPTQRSFF